MELFWSALLSGVVTGGYYALIGVGLALVFGAMHVVNLAHGEVLMVAAYTTYLAYTGWSLPLPAAAGLGVAAAGLTGAAAYGLIVPIRRASPLSSMVLTYGVAIVLISGMLELWGADPRSIAFAPFLAGIALGPLRISVGEGVAFLVSLAAVALVWLFLHRTWTGRAVRAVSQNRTAAASLGVNPFAVDAVAFVLGALLAGLGGALVVMVQSVTPVGAPLFTIKAFVVVVLAGLGSAAGVLCAGFLLGIGEALTSAFFDPALSGLVAFALFLGVLLYRPQGLFGERT